MHAERYPLSGASRFRDSGHDIDVYAFGKDAAPLIAECKARRNGQGFKQLEDWLADYDVLFLRRNHAEPMVMLRWRKHIKRPEKDISRTTILTDKPITPETLKPRHDPECVR